MEQRANPHAGQQALQVVRDYLARMEARDLDGAQALLAPDGVIVFPGGTPLGNAHDIAAFGARRYQRIGKTYDHMEAHATAEGSVRVISQGTLHGTALGGREFSGIRYVDLFVVREGRIVRQDVYNDLAESGVLAE